MKTLACQDMGVECDYVAKADSDDEVMKMAMEHAQNVHAQKIKEMTETMTEEEMNKAMKSKIKEEA